MRCERIGDAELYLGDCMEYMAGVDDKYFELSCVDPPYGVGSAKTHTGNGWVVRENKTWDSAIPDGMYFDELFRVSKNQIICGANYFTKYIPPSQGWVFWDKGQRNFSLADGEFIYTSFDVASRVFSFSRGEMQAEYRGKKFHPTTKPVALYKWLLSRYAKPGDKILDTHGGSGSSVVACIEMGYPIVWIEKDPDYYEAALDRIRRAWQNRPRLFEDNTPPTQGELL